MTTYKLLLEDRGMKISKSERKYRKANQSIVYSQCHKAPVIYPLDSDCPYGQCCICGIAQNSHILFTPRRKRL